MTLAQVTGEKLPDQQQLPTDDDETKEVMIAATKAALEAMQEVYSENPDVKNLVEQAVG